MGEPSRQASLQPASLWPVVISLGVLCGLNALWNLPVLVGQVTLHAAVVYLIGGSGLAIFFVWRALNDGRLTKRAVGLAASGWRPLKRLFALALILLVALGGFSSLHTILPPGFVDASQLDSREEHDSDLTVVTKPTWGDFCFWIVALLAADLAEVLVFIAVGFCFLEQWLRDRRLPRVEAAAVAMVFSSVAFGLYHYTHPPHWWPLVFVPLMPVMLINLICFVITRNLYLTLALHSCFAGLGLTLQQYMMPEMSVPAATKLLPTLVGFVLPILVLHWIELHGPSGETPTQS